MSKRRYSQLTLESTGAPKRSRSMSASSDRYAQRGNDITTENRSVTNQSALGPAGLRKSNSRVKYRLPVKSRLARLEKMVPPIEKHYKLIQDNSVGTITNGSPYSVLLNGIARGDTVQDRTGDQVALGKGHLEMTLQHAPITTNSTIASLAKIVVVLDAQANASALTTTILTNDAGPDVTTPWNFNNYDFWKRFTILHEEVISLETELAGIQGGIVENIKGKFVKFGWDCRDFMADYGGGNAGTIADIRSGFIYLFVWITGTTDVNGRFSSVQYFKDV